MDLQRWFLRLMMAILLTSILAPSVEAGTRNRLGVRTGYYFDAGDVFIGGEYVSPFNRRLDFNPNIEFILIDNASYFGFTATPKGRTLELFGMSREEAIGATTEDFWVDPEQRDTIGRQLARTALVKLNQVLAKLLDIQEFLDVDIRLIRSKSARGNIQHLLPGLTVAIQHLPHGAGVVKRRVLDHVIVFRLTTQVLGRERVVQSLRHVIQAPVQAVYV